MITGNVNSFKASGLVSERLEGYIELLRGIGMDAELGRYELEDGAFYLVQECKGRPREGAKFESHKRYIDVQYIVSGEEDMEVADLDRLTLTDEYDEAGDYMLHDGAGARLHFGVGDFAVYFPTDGHMPSLGDGVTRKVVIKIPVRD